MTEPDARKPSDALRRFELDQMTKNELIDRLIAAEATSEPERQKPGELGPVGRAILSALGIAILLPFIGIIWAWAVGVINGLLVT